MPAPAVSALPSPWADSVPAEPLAITRRLKVPSVEQGLAYTCRWWAATVPGLLRRHRLQPRRARRYETSFEPRPELGERFAELFDLPDGANGPDGLTYPFLYAQSVISLLQARVLADLGVNRRHVHHLRHRTRLPDGAQPCLDAVQQRLECRLLRAVRVGPDEALVLMETRIADVDDRTLALVEDGFVVHELPRADALQADEDDGLRRAVSRMRRRTAEISNTHPEVRMRTLFIAPDAGRRFGDVAGERGIAHVSRLGARLLGRRRPFVQSQYLRNLVARELVEWGLPQSNLLLTFTAQARLGQTLRLLLQDGAFELVDERGRLVAFGSV
ncbi:MAG: hypothetical protein LCI02_14135 [Proteobacteria bacterium]|nr:hypothetical protein [Pseudomonadota bacterium]